MLYTRLTSRPRRSFFLFGVRGVGKSTWARSELPDAARFDLLDEALFHELIGRPGRFAEMVAGIPDQKWIVVDEVQRAPALLNEVHRLIEERGRRFALLGSSARKLRAAGTNLLAGRAGRKAMFPLVPEEMGQDFDLERVLRLGSLPLVLASEDPARTLRDYVALYLREEIRAEAAVRNLGGFVRFLPIAALLHGQTLSVSGIARDAGVARSTVAGYLEVLEDTMLASRLGAFEAKLRVRERRRPKLYWTDPGLVRAAKGLHGPLAPEERGALFEGWVLSVLRAYAEERTVFDDIHYWSPAESRVEVDFLLRREREFLAIEAKAAERYQTGMLRGLRAVDGLPGLARRLLVYGGSRSFRTDDGIEIWPAIRFAEELAAGTLWP